MSENKEININNVLVLGAGLWGSALAYTLSQNVNKIILFGLPVNFKEKNIQELLEKSKNIEICTNVDLINDNIEMVVFAVPTQVTRIVTKNVRSFIEKQIKNKSTNSKLKICVASKGIENDTGNLVTDIIQDTLGEELKNLCEFGALSGPNFAKEVLSEVPSITNIAFQNIATSKDIAKCFETKYFKLIPITDVNGVQICGAMKNVYAIINGIASGLKLGKNTEAAIFERSFREMSIFLKSMGGQMETLLEPAGIGDFMLTCTNKESRNMNFGIQIASQTSTINRFLEEHTVEGYHTVKIIHEIAIKNNIKAPIAEALYNILYIKKEVYEDDFAKIIRNIII